MEEITKVLNIYPVFSTNLVIFFPLFILPNQTHHNLQIVRLV